MVFITNMRDEIDRERYLGPWRPASGHVNGPRYHLNGKLGRIRAIDAIAEDLLTPNGRRKAQEHFISAVRWAEKRGAKVILLAAGTKRLFGEDGAKLKAMFPDLLFTIGDNGTALILRNEVGRAFTEAGLEPGSSRIGVLGPSGHLGKAVISYLSDKGYSVVGLGTNPARLGTIERAFNIEVCSSFQKMGSVDAVVACTHKDENRLTAEIVGRIRKPGKKLLVIDVAEPENLTPEEYRACEGKVIRLDAGNAFSPALEYVLGAASYRMLRLTRGVTFGCFAEALSFASVFTERLKTVGWFAVNGRNMEIVSDMYTINGFTTPSHRCYGVPVESLDLALDSEAVIDFPKASDHSETAAEY